MSSYHSLASGLLRDYPALFPEPLDVFVHLMGETSEYAWSAEGDLVATMAKIGNQAMRYDDLNEEENALDRGDPMDRAYILECQAARQRRAFVEQNMDALLAGPPHSTYFRESFHLSKAHRNLILGQASTSEAKFLRFPDNITPEWGEKIQQFHEWILQRMNMELGTSISGADTHWPEPSRILKERVMMARERLHPLLNDGQSYADYQARNLEMVDGLIDEILLEEKAAPVAPRGRRP